MRLVVLFMVAVLLLSGCTALKEARESGSQEKYTFSQVESRIKIKGYILNESEIHDTLRADTDLIFKKIEKTEKYYFVHKDAVETDGGISPENRIRYFKTQFETRQKCIDELVLEQSDWCNVRVKEHTCEESPGTLVVREKETEGFTKAFKCINSTLVEVFGYDNIPYIIE